MGSLYKSCLTVFRQRPETIIGAGNCLRKNSHLRAVLEERLDCRIVLAKNEEEAAYGAALFALGEHRAMGSGGISESKQGA